MKESSLLLGALILLATPLLAQEQVTAKWSDPSRPGLLKVDSVWGSISIKTHATNDVTVTTTSRRNRVDDRIIRRPPPPETTGLRRIDSGGSAFTIESDSSNVITVTGGDLLSGIGDLTIEVPKKTNLNLQAQFGKITIDGVEGDIEATSFNGRISLTNVTGSVVAHSMNGTVAVSFQNIAEGKPMSFTSMNGNVDVTLPAASKANLKMRTALGGIYTDFDIQMATSSTNPTQEQSGLRRIRVEKNINGTINGGGAEFDLRSQNGNIYLRKAK
jgi:DUF4097 and DUF4098 domain-containing protein YvlB